MMDKTWIHYLRFSTLDFKIKFKHMVTFTNKTKCYFFQKQ